MKNHSEALKILREEIKKIRELVVKAEKETGQDLKLASLVLEEIRDIIYEIESVNDLSGGYEQLADSARNLLTLIQRSIEDI